MLDSHFDLHYFYSSINVTHDQVEAMALADRIVVLNEGHIQQLGTPSEVYNRPANTFVATFIGNPAMNLLKATYKDSYLFIGKQKNVVPEHILPLLQNRSEVWLGIRPENCQFAPIKMNNGKEKQESVILSGKIENIEYLGNQKNLHLQLDDGQVLTISNGPDIEVQDKIYFSWDKVNFFNLESGMNLAYLNK